MRMQIREENDGVKNGMLKATLTQERVEIQASKTESFPVPTTRDENIRKKTVSFVLPGMRCSASSRQEEGKNGMGGEERDGNRRPAAGRRAGRQSCR